MVLLTQFTGLLSLALIDAATCEQDNFIYDNTAIPITADNATTAGCHQSCLTLLASGSPELEVFYPELPADFDYYAQQQLDLRPLCVVRPKAVAVVASIIKSVVNNECPFAIRSGGHSTATGKSNRDNGLVIDMVHFNHIRISDDESAVSLGPGVTWGDAYDHLEPHGLTTGGGRVAEVAVGGFTLGGGISFLARRRGWAFDNVLSFEVVLPNGTVARASETSHQDLYFALRGGGSNFGIVTDFEFETCKDVQFWGGTNVYLVEDLAQRKSSISLQNEKFEWTWHSASIRASHWLQKAGRYFGYGRNTKELIEEFVALGNTAGETSAHAWIFFSFVPRIQGYLTGGLVATTQVKEPPATLRFLSKPSGLMSTNGEKSMSAFSKEVSKDNPVGERQLWRTSTFKLDAGLISKLMDIQLEESEPIITSIPGLLVSTNFQLLPKSQLALAARRGGNAFGLDPDDGPLCMASLTISYKAVKDDEEIVLSMSRKIVSRWVELGKSMGLHNRFIYPNYAAADQDVLAGYSPKTLQRLKDIQAVYDPERKFAKLQPHHNRLL